MTLFTLKIKTFFILLSILFGKTPKLRTIPILYRAFFLDGKPEDARMKMKSVFNAIAPATNSFSASLLQSDYGYEEATKHFIVTVIARKGVGLSLGLQPKTYTRSTFISNLINAIHYVEILPDDFFIPEPPSPETDKMKGTA